MPCVPLSRVCARERMTRGDCGRDPAWLAQTRQEVEMSFRRLAVDVARRDAAGEVARGCFRWVEQASPCENLVRIALINARRGWIRPICAAFARCSLGL